MGCSKAQYGIIPQVVYTGCHWGLTTEIPVGHRRWSNICPNGMTDLNELEPECKGHGSFERKALEFVSFPVPWLRSKVEKVVERLLERVLERVVKLTIIRGTYRWSRSKPYFLRTRYLTWMLKLHFNLLHQLQLLLARERALLSGYCQLKHGSSQRSTRNQFFSVRLL